MFSMRWATISISRCSRSAAQCCRLPMPWREHSRLGGDRYQTPDMRYRDRISMNQITPEPTLHIPGLTQVGVFLDYMTSSSTISSVIIISSSAIDMDNKALLIAVSGKTRQEPSSRLRTLS
ncbi:hypothetical protein V8F20_007457 [Naviculisporaceae sp. PSN 640]